MHEAALVQALLARVRVEAARHDGATVRRVAVTLGELGGVEPDLLRTAYELLAPGTCCASATLDIEWVPARWRCPCGASDVPGTCSRCGEASTLRGGAELLLESVELEVEDVRHVRV